MNTIVNKITIDLMKPAQIPVIHAVQGERDSRIAELTLVADGKPWTLPNGALLTVRYGRNALSGGYYDTLPDGSAACSYADNVITVVLAPQMMAQAGAVLAQVEILHENQLLTTFSFRLMVEVNPAIGILQPENYVNWLQWMQKQLELYTEQIIVNGDFSGPAGPAGAPATLKSSQVVYQAGTSGTNVPTGSWTTTVPVVPQGKYLWTRVTNTFNSGDPVVSYSVARMGLDGSGSVASVANVSPDANGNVPLTAQQIGALPDTGGDLTGELNMNGSTIRGLGAPAADDQAANLEYVKKASPWNILDNSNFANPVNQRGQTSYKGTGYGIDRWYCTSAHWMVTMEDGYLKVSDNPDSTGTSTTMLRQTITVPSNLRGKTVTLAAKLKGDGMVRLNINNTAIGVYGGSDDWHIKTVTGVVPADADTFYVALQSRNMETYYCEWVALYEGEFTAETLPAYRPKGYAVELLECQRYYVSFGSMVFRSTISEDPIHNITITFPVRMRIVPTVTATAIEGEAPEANVCETGIAYSAYGEKYTLRHVTASADL